jgi:hypothetical protein
VSEDLPATEGRELTCTRCLELVEVYELPGPWIAEELFVCMRCRQGEQPAPQLELLQGGRRETPAYDPSQASIPF